MKNVISWDRASAELGEDSTRAPPQRKPDLAWAVQQADPEEKISFQLSSKLPQRRRHDQRQTQLQPQNTIRNWRSSSFQSLRNSRGSRKTEEESSFDMQATEVSDFEMFGGYWKCKLPNYFVFNFKLNINIIAKREARGDIFNSNLMLFSQAR